MRTVLARLQPTIFADSHDPLDPCCSCGCARGDGETIFKLANAQIWQQAEYDYMYPFSYGLDVTIYATPAGCRMRVEDEIETILVKRIK